MRTKTFVRAAAMLAVLGASLVATSAFAQEKDGARFRGGIALEGGIIAVPGLLNVGVGGITAQLGVQINNQFGIYVAPSAGAAFNDIGGGVNFAAAVVADYTMFDGMLSVGAGPDIGNFALIGGSFSGGGVSQRAAAGELYGARIHVGFQPAIGIGENGYRRKAFSIGLDIRMLGGYGGVAQQSVGTGGVNQSVAATSGSFTIAPMLSIGYLAF